MVKSGLIDNPNVSQYRLSIHLITAFLTCAFTLWVALPLIYTKKTTGNENMQKILFIYFLLVIIQIIYGAFVAGLDGGGGFNSWPKMLGEWIPEAVYTDSKGYNPIWFIEHRWGVQFIHRTLGILIFAFTIYIWQKGMKISPMKEQKKILSIILLIVLIQTFLGIITLTLGAPVYLA
jgi:cytochrome c oxidase assembly protein subunit 15